MGLDMKEEARCAFAEFSATLLFVFFGPGSVCAALQATGGLGPVEPVNYALSFGCMFRSASNPLTPSPAPALPRARRSAGERASIRAGAITILAFSVGNVSGAHINPAVTLSMMVTKNISPVRGAIYMVAQTVGGLCGGGILRACVGAANFKSGIGLAPTVTAGGGLLLEFVGTLLLIFVVFNVAVWAGSKNTDLNTNVISALAPIPIGLAVMVSHLTLGPFTGCGINPARVIGAVVYEENFWDGHAGKNFWIYIVGPFLASLCGPLFYMVLEGTSAAGASGDAKKSASVAAASTTSAGDADTPVVPYNP